MNELVNEFAASVGLHTPVPSRWEEMPDDLLEHYIVGMAEAVRRNEYTPIGVDQMVCAVNEFLKARHHRFFDEFEEIYYAVPTLTPRDQVFFSLDRLAGTKEPLLDRMLEMYMTDRRSIGSTSEMIKEYFQLMVARKGKQRHWDLIAQTADTQRDIEMLVLFSNKFKKKLDRRGVNAWIPELDSTQRVISVPPTTEEEESQ